MPNKGKYDIVKKWDIRIVERNQTNKSREQAIKLYMKVNIEIAVGIILGISQNIWNGLALFVCIEKKQNLRDDFPKDL